VSKWRHLSFIFNQESREKKGGWETAVILILVKEIPGEKGEWSNVVMQQPFIMSPNFGK
jgi:hypothetical protein